MSDTVGGLGTILGIWAHPDDELFNMGGIMAMAAQNGQKVICVTATRGEAGVQDESRWPAGDLGEIRTRELEAAYEILGVSGHEWLDYPDGGCADVDEGEAVQRLTEIIKKYQPDTVLTFEPNGMTGHDDHKAVSRWSSLALDLSGHTAQLYHSALTSAQYQAFGSADKTLNVFFNIDQPTICEQSDCDIYVELSDELYQLKLDSLAAMPSQMERMLSEYQSTLRPALGVEAFKGVNK